MTSLGELRDIKGGGAAGQWHFWDGDGTGGMHGNTSGMEDGTFGMQNGTSWMENDIGGIEFGADVTENVGEHQWDGG